VSFKAAIAQINPRLGDLRANLELHEAEIRRAVKEKADLVLFPELSLTGYFLRDVVPTVALKLSSKEIGRLKALSRDVAFVVGLVEESPDYRFYNSAVYFDGGEIRHVHRKVYLPTYGMFDEQRYFARGDRVRAFDTKFGRFALLICEDLWHCSAVYLAALDGAAAILAPSASPLRGFRADQTQDDNARYWEMINRTYAESFGLFLIYGNRFGFEDGVGFWGGSEIIDPFGKRIVKAKYYEGDFIVGDVLLAAARRKRISAPLLRDEDLDLTINELIRIRGRPERRSARSSPPAGKNETSRAAGRRGKGKSLTRRKSRGR
jgi:predicted amidohydrolase